MEIKIALAGNPNCGKTTLFNNLTGSNQFVGNWPGVTVEKKEGRLKHNKDVKIIDLPGIYSLSPYTLEEVIARDFLIEEKPDVIINIIDGTNLERNLYLTTQLKELGIPIVAALNMSDILQKQNDVINIDELSRLYDMPVVEISALKNIGLDELQKTATAYAGKKAGKPVSFSPELEETLSKIEALLPATVPADKKRWYAIKLFERDEKVLEKIKLTPETSSKIDELIEAYEDRVDDDSESIVTDERYNAITSSINKVHKKDKTKKLSLSDKIDRVVTNRYLALPIFALVMFVVYFISVTTVGTWTTDFVNDGVFGDGFFLFGAGREHYEEALGEYDLASQEIEAFEEMQASENLTPDQLKSATAQLDVYSDEGELEEVIPVDYATYLQAQDVPEPEPSQFGTFVPGIPVIVQNFLESVDCAEWLQGLILDGIIGGVGAVLGFVPQMFVLFFLLAFLEGCGYMARVAFVMDRIFRKFGLSGKSFIPMLIGTGCGVPGIMASRTIENERDRRMTIITTTFIPCGAKLPIIALIAGALFGGAWWVAPSAYLIGAFSIVLSGIILKKTSMFSGEPAPFVMELPPYHLPPLKNLLSSMWERGYSFIKKAGTIILLATTLVWFLSNFGFEDGRFGMVDMQQSMLAVLGSAISFIFIPLGWGTWQGAVATLTGLIAKENVVGTFGVLFGGMSDVAENGWQVWQNMQAVFTPAAAFSFLTFNLLCAPCFAAIGAIKREMNSTKWTLFAVAYQCVFAYCVSLVIYQFGAWIYGDGSILGTVIAVAVLAIAAYLAFRPAKQYKPMKAGAELQ